MKIKKLKEILAKLPIEYQDFDVRAYADHGQIAEQMHSAEVCVAQDESTAEEDYYDLDLIKAMDREYIEDYLDLDVDDDDDKGFCKNLVENGYKFILLC